MRFNAATGVRWRSSSNPAIGTAWQILFSRYNRRDFTRREITGYIHDFVEKEGLKVGDSVIARDVDCIEYVEELEDTMGGSIILDETAGLKQIYRRQTLDPLK